MLDAPIRLAVLGWKFWQRKSGYLGDIVSFAREKWGNRANWASGRGGLSANHWPGFAAGATGNRAFDELRATELARLEEEHKRLAAAEREFANYMENLRHTKDREEFERFINQRRDRQGLTADTLYLHVLRTLFLKVVLRETGLMPQKMGQLPQSSPIDRESW